MRGKRHTFVQFLHGQGNIPAYAGKTGFFISQPDTLKEHPRVCGENPGSDWEGTLRDGTSPRMRGKRCCGSTSQRLIGNIPAYAGKTGGMRKNAGGEKEHPRVCGENEWSTASPITQTGTSPRMRGKRCRLRIITSGTRNIPAYAGKTFMRWETVVAIEEHPRVCGENNHGWIIRQRQLGTSPRMRGKLDARGYGVPSRRNIPAYAGKTPDTHLNPVSTLEHPRVCGENVRGRIMARAAAWNIPAYAGKTLLCTFDRPRDGEHPRVCGENAAVRASIAGLPGTSPRMRGKQSGQSAETITARNIPAYAGKTAGSGRLFPWCAEHPRVCGENHYRRCRHPSHRGTSPRMRGKLELLKHDDLSFRNIPAYAGKTLHRGSDTPQRREHPRVCGENTY